MNMELVMKKRPAESAAAPSRDDVDDHEVEQFFALIRNTHEARDRFSRSSKLRRGSKKSNNNNNVDDEPKQPPKQEEIIIEAEKADEEKLIWIPSFKWEDFVDISRLRRSESPAAADTTTLTFYNGPHHHHHHKIINNYNQQQEEDDEEDHSEMKEEILDLNLSL